MISLLKVSICISTIFKKATTLGEARFNPKYLKKNRKMPFIKLLNFLISGRKAASQAALDEFFLKEGDTTHMSQQALSKARNHFDHSPFEKAFFAARDLDYNLDSDNSLERFHG